MSTKNSTVSLTLLLKGSEAASNALRKVGKEQLDGAQKVTAAIKEQASVVRATDAARQLGIRTEKQINAEIVKNIQAYDRLKASGVASANDTSRAYQAMRRNVQALNNELRTTGTLGQGIGNGLQTAAMVGAGLAGAAYAINQPVQRTVNYQRDLYYSSATLATKQADQAPTRQWMNEVVVKGATANGIARDDSFLTMDALVADGVYADKDGNLIKTKQNIERAHAAAGRAALASGGDAQDFAAVGMMAAKRGLGEKNVQGMILQADQMGAMRAKDLARVMKPSMALMAADPASNARSVAQLIAAHEVVMDSSSSADDAGTNMKNLYGKMISDDTNKRLKKDFDIDLVQRTANDKKKGKTSLDTFLDVTQEIIGKDPKMKAIQKKLATAGTPEEAQLIYQSQQNVIEQSGLAKIIPDMQSLLALVALSNKRDKLNEITAASISKGEAALDSRADDAGKHVDKAGINAAKVTSQNAEYMAMQDVTPMLSEWGKMIGEYSATHPAMTKAAGYATVALTALAAAGGLAAGANILTGGGAGGGAAGGIAGGVLGKVKGAATADPMVVGGALALGFGYAAGTVTRDQYMQTESGMKFDDYIGREVTDLMAFLGNDNAQAALESQAKYDEMIAQQTQQLAELKILNASLKNLPAPVVTLNGDVVSDFISGKTSTQSKRGAGDGTVLR